MKAAHVAAGRICKSQHTLQGMRGGPGLYRQVQITTHRLRSCARLQTAQVRCGSRLGHVPSGHTGVFRGYCCEAPETLRPHAFCTALRALCGVPLACKTLMGRQCMPLLIYQMAMARCKHIIRRAMPAQLTELHLNPCRHLRT